MNYFELFDMAPTLRIDQSELRKKYLALSRKFHPDYFAQGSAADLDMALEKTAMVNKAFKIFGNKDSTIKYLLQEKGLLEEEEKYNLPQDFLMEMMDLNEVVEDAGSEHLLTQAKNTIEEKEIELYEAIKKLVESYVDGITTKEELLQVKDYYFKKKYLLRLRSLLTGKL